jgi:hypothetical protein
MRMVGHHGRVNKWRPIETAPVNTDILIAGSSPMFVGKVHVGFVENKHYWLTGSDCQTGCGDTGTPTHWMPLPEVGE